VLCVYEGQRRLWKDDMMLDADHEVRIPLQGGDGRAWITDLDVQTLRRAEGVLNATEEEKGHLPAFKYLFELLGIYPAPAVEHPEAEDSKDLTRVLLSRFDFPYKGPGDEEATEGTKEPELVPAGVQDDSVE